MIWLEHIPCPCGEPVNWQVVDGSWTCAKCGRTMTPTDILGAHTCTSQWNPRCWCEDDTDYLRRTANK